MKLFLEHRETKRRYSVIGFDKEAGTIRLKGEVAEFDEPFDKERLTRMGYDLKKEEA